VSAKGFAPIGAEHSQAVRGFLRRLTGNAAEADDLAQEVFVTAWQNAGAFREGGDMRAWLNGIAYRKFLTARRGFFRRLRRDAVSIEGAAQTAPGTDADLRLDLAKAMQALPVEQRAVVALCLAQGATHEEAAQTLNLPLGTVKSHINRGREKLVAAMGGRDG
jgi:RNA polymerase sigma-70 factor (ECF subfamily)